MPRGLALAALCLMSFAQEACGQAAIEAAQGWYLPPGATYNGRDLTPRLAGRNPLYTEKQLKGMRIRKRERPQDAGIAALTDRETQDLSHFFASLK